MPKLTRRRSEDRQDWTFMFEVMIIKRDQMGMASVRRQRNRRNARMGKGSQVAKYRGERALFLLLAAGAAAA